MFEVEAMTNDRVRDESEKIALVPPQERISGPGTTPIMAAFTHLNPEGSRFSDGSFGVYIARRSSTPRSPKCVTTRRGSCAAPTKDRCASSCGCTWPTSTRVWRMLARWPRAIDPTTTGRVQAVGIAARAAGRDGVLYRSVRHAGGTCAAVLRPKLLATAASLATTLFTSTATA